MTAWPHGYGRCHCGCGRKTNIARQTRPKYGHVKGRPYRYLRGHQVIGSMRRLDKHGYVMVWRPDHPRARTNGYVLEHLLVIERALGRPVPLKHDTHHVNGKKGDNRPRNLVLCEDRAYHRLLERRARALGACGHADWLRCGHCSEYSPPESMYVLDGNGRHRACHADYEASRRRRAG